MNLPFAIPAIIFYDVYFEGVVVDSSSMYCHPPQNKPGVEITAFKREIGGGGGEDD